MFRAIFYLFLTYPTLIFATVVMQDVYWRDYMPGNIPYDAFLVGTNRYVMQAVDSANMGDFPGTLYPDTHIGAMDMNGKKLATNHMKILCATDVNRLYWEHVDFAKPHDKQMKNAVKGGYQTAHDLFIGSVADAGELKIGKVIPLDILNTNGLYIWDTAGRSKKVLQFELLKYNTTIVSSDGTVIFKD